MFAYFDEILQLVFVAVGFVISGVVSLVLILIVLLLVWERLTGTL